MRNSSSISGSSRNCYSSICSEQCCGPNSLLYHLEWGLFFQDVKWPVIEADLSSPCIAEVL